MVKRYVDAKDFNDFKKSFETMVDVFNHRVSEIGETSKETNKSVGEIAKGLYDMKTDVAVTKEKTKNNNFMIKWILGIIALVVVGGVLSGIGA